MKEVWLWNVEHINDVNLRGACEDFNCTHLQELGLRRSPICCMAMHRNG